MYNQHHGMGSRKKDLKAGGKGRTTKKKELFLKIEKKSLKNVATKSEGDKALVARPLIKYLFCGFPYQHQKTANRKIF